MKAAVCLNNANPILTTTDWELYMLTITFTYHFLINLLHNYYYLDFTTYEQLLFLLYLLLHCY